MKPLGDLVLVKKVEKDEVKVSGIILPPTMQVDEYEVLAVGPKASVLKVGDVVRKYKFAKGMPVIYRGKDCLLFKEDGEIESIVKSTSN